MAATERVVVLMTPEQKSDVTLRAAAQKLSVGDYMRRQALGDDELLGALMEELTASTERARSALDRTIARLDETERRLPEIEATARVNAFAEFQSLDPELFARLVRQPAASA